MELIRKVDAAVARCEKGLIILLFWGLIGLIVFNIVARNLFQLSFSKIFEIAPACVLWLALLGGSLALREGRHIRLELFLRYCPQRVRRMAAVAVNLCGMLIMAVLVYAALIFLVNELALFGMWGGVAIIFPLFFLLAFFRLTTRLIFTLGEFRESRESPTEGGVK